MIGSTLLDDIIRLDPAAPAGARSAPADARADQWFSKARRAVVHTWVNGFARVGLGTRLLFLMLLPLVPFCALVGVAGLFDRNEHIAFAASRAGLLATAAAAQANRSMHTAAGLIGALRDIGAFEASEPTCTNLLRRLSEDELDQGSAGIAGISLFGQDGGVRCTSKPMGSDANVADRDWFKLAVGIGAEQFVVSRPIESRVFGKHVIVLASPLRPGDPTSGVISVALDTAWVAELAAKLSADQGVILVIDRSDGTVIGGSAGVEPLLGRRFPGHPLTAEVLSMPRTWTGTLPDYGGVPRVFGLAAVDGPSDDYATIAVGFPERAVLAAANIRLATVMGAVAAGTVLVALVAWRLSLRVLLQPLRHLTRQMRSVHLGNLSGRARPLANTSPELRRLFDSFDAMSAALQARDEALATSRTELAASEEHHRILAESATDMITRFDANLVRIYVSPACRDVLGYEPEELIGRPPQGIIHGDDVAMVNATLNSALRTGQGEARAVYRALRKDGREVWLETSGRRLPGGLGAVVVTRDVSERKRFEAFLETANRQLDQLARLDALTKLNNRRAFDEQLAFQTHGSLEDGTSFALVMFDVDWFKAYNDTYGHQAGDECLKAVAAVTQTVLRDAGDFAARYGGEEFAVILPGADAAGASLVASRIVDALAATPLPHSASPLGRVTVSLGIACFAPCSEEADPDQLLARADAALYKAKHAGRNGFHIAATGGDA